MLTTIYLPTRISFGPGAIDTLGEEARQLGRRALIVTYTDMRRLGLLDRVVANLKAKGVEAVVFDKLEPNPRSLTIDAGAKLAREEKVDLIIGLGGGSAMDAAKCIALASAGTAPIWDYVMGRAQSAGVVPPLIQAPTLAGTGSEGNQIAVVTEWQSHEKRVVMDPRLFARVAVIDPALTVTVPKNQTACGGLDIFSHVAEAYLMPETPFPLNDAVREAVMKTVVRSLPEALANPDDIDARAQLSWASTAASCGLSRVGGSAGSMTCHAIEHAVSGYYDVTHGLGLAALLPAWMRSFAAVRPERFALLGENVFGHPDGLHAFEEWLVEVGLKVRLRDLGCELARAEEIAEIAVRTRGTLNQHPVNLDAAAIAKIYREAW